MQVRAKRNAPACRKLRDLFLSAFLRPADELLDDRVFDEPLEAAEDQQPRIQEPAPVVLEIRVDVPPAPRDNGWRDNWSCLELAIPGRQPGQDFLAALRLLRDELRMARDLEYNVCQAYVDHVYAKAAVVRSNCPITFGKLVASR